MPADRKIAGIRCSEILAALNAYIAKELPADTVSMVEAHLRECNWCAEFGKSYAATVSSLRQELLEDRAQDDAFAQALLRSRESTS